MGNMLIKNVPEDVHRAFKAHCATAGTTIQDAVIEMLKREAEKPISVKKDSEK